MTVPVVAFFNNKSGVGKTFFTYHLAWMYADLDMNVLAADLDSQADLSAAFLEDERLAELWPDSGPHPRTVYGAIEPLVHGVGDIPEHPHVERIDDQVHLIVGDLALARFEDELSQQWHQAPDRDEHALRVLTAFWRVLQAGARRVGAEVVLVDLGPNLGAINRAAMIAADFVVVPLAPDLFSLRGLEHLGPTLAAWREGWRQRREQNPTPELDMPRGRMHPLGYVVPRHAIRLDRPDRTWTRRIRRIPSTYAEYVDGRVPAEDLDFGSDPNCLGLMKHYRSLVPMGQEARKPIFHLRPGDGAIGSHFVAVQDARSDFETLAVKIADRWQLAAGDESL